MLAGLSHAIHNLAEVGCVALFCFGRQIMNEGWRPIEMQIEAVLSELAPTGCFYLHFCMAWGYQSLNFNRSVPLTVTAKIHPKIALGDGF